MRRKDKLICDECLSFIKELDQEQMDKIEKDKSEGARTNCSAICGKCSSKYSDGCGELIFDNDPIKCGEWSGGDQHFCKRCFASQGLGEKDE